MKRWVFLAVTAAALLAGAALAWNAVRQEREFRRLIAVGDEALAEDQSFEAIEAFSGALALKNDSMLAHLKRGESYRRRGELTAALRDLRDASALDRSAPRPLEQLADVNVAMGRYERAAELYRQFITLDDRAPRVLYKLALTYYRRGEIALAIDPLRRAIAMDDRMAEAHYLLGLCLRDRKRAPDAVRSLQRAIAIAPAFVAAREELADLYASLGRNRERIEQLESLAALEPGRAQRQISVGVAYAHAGRTDAAIATLGRAAERRPDEPVASTALGRVWLESAELHHDKVALARAMEVLQPAAVRASAPSDTLALYGHAQFLSGSAEAAERTLQQAAATLPVQPAAFLYLSAAAQQLGHVAIARDALIQYVTLLEDDEQKRAPSAQIASLSLRMNDPATTVTWAQRALDPNNPDVVVLGQLADAQLRLGRITEARHTLVEGLSRDPGNATLLRLQRKAGR